MLGVRIYFCVACNVVGFLPIFVALSAVVLIVLHCLQLRSLYAFLSKPGPHSSSHHNRPTQIFWRMVSVWYISHN